MQAEENTCQKLAVQGFCAKNTIVITERLKIKIASQLELPRAYWPSHNSFERLFQMVRK